MRLYKPLVLLCAALLCATAASPRSVRAQPPPASPAAPQPPAFQASPDVKILLDKGKTESDARHWPQALGAYEQALAKAIAEMDKAGEAKSLNSIGNVYAITDRLSKARGYYEQALTIWQALGDKTDEVKALNNIALVYTYTGEPAKALDYCRQALLICRADGDKAGEANTLGNIGGAYHQTGQLPKSLEFYEQALPIYHLLGDKSGEAKALGNIGIVSKSAGHTPRALEAYRQALSVFRELGDKENQASSLLNIGALYADTFQYPQALDYYKRALILERDLGDRGGEASTLHNMGVAYASTGQTSKALDMYRQALPVFHNGGDKANEAITLNSIANVHANLRQYAQALSAYQQTLVVFRAIGDRADEAITLNSIGFIYADMGSSGKAAASYRQALSLFQANGDKVNEITALTNIGDCEARQNHPALAENALKQAVALLEAQRNDLGSLTESKVAFTASYLGTYEAYLDLLIRQKRIGEAFALAQQMKARALLDLLVGGKVDLTARLSTQERTQLVALRARPDALSQQMIAEGARNEVGAKKRFAHLQEQLRQAERDLSAYTDTLYVQHPDVARARAVHTLSAAEAARLLPPATALLEYATRFDTRQTQGKASPVLFVVTPDGKVTAHDLPVTTAQVKGLVTAFHAACADPRSPYQAQAKQLYQLLLAPAQARVAGSKHLLVCPDGPLWNVPFAALADSRGRFVADQHNITYAYSATGAAIALAKRTQPRAAHSILALANPDFGNAARFGDIVGLAGQRPFDRPSRPFDRPSRPFDRPSRPFDRPSRPFDRPSRPFDRPSRPFDLPSRPFDRPSRDVLQLLRGGGIASLPGTQAEADTLHRLYPDAMILTGKNAQEGAFKRMAGQYRILHLASHAFFNDAAPLLSCVFLAAPPASGPGSDQDGYLTARELIDMKLNAELVTLSACQTAQGATHAGEGVIGLTWALTVAGVPTQVVSQWSVDDNATATLMQGFYTRLRSGTGKGDALNAAAHKLRNKSGRRHPYYWAPFVLVGDWR